MESRHRLIAEIALRAAGPFEFALAGGYAVQAYGIGDRPSGDVDLFTDWQRRADFPAAADVVVAAFTEHQYAVRVVARGETFARLVVSAPGSIGEDAEDGEEGAIGPEAAVKPRDFVRAVRSAEDRLNKIEQDEEGH